MLPSCSKCCLYCAVGVLAGYFFTLLTWLSLAENPGRSQEMSLFGANPEIEQLKDMIEELRNEIRMLRNGSQKGVPAQRVKKYPPVKFLGYNEKKRILVTGGSGFVGSHLVDRLLSEGHQVVSMDNHFTGRRSNIEQWIGHPNFQLMEHDVVNPFYVEVDEVYHLASPASPPQYMYNPVKTIKTNVLGTINVLGLSRRTKARVLLASTSEVYGDPIVHPQPETYWGNVNPVGPRSCYDEGKRIAESLMVAYHRQEKIDIRIARIFNTYGPRMHMSDGRVVSNFIVQAIENRPLTIYGNGRHTRSFQYVSDLVEGLVRLMASNVTEPVNFGNPEEYEIEEFAKVIKEITGCTSQVVHLDEPVDDPQVRRPDISRAKTLLGWEPKVSVRDGLRKTILYFREELRKEADGKSLGYLNV